MRYILTRDEYVAADRHGEQLVILGDLHE